MIELPEPCTIETIADVLAVLRYQERLTPIEDWVDWLNTSQTEAIRNLLS